MIQIDRDMTCAIMDDELNWVEWLISQGADLSSHKYHCLRVAIWWHRYEIFDYLMGEIKRKAKLDGYLECERTMKND